VDGRGVLLGDGALQQMRAGGGGQPLGVVKVLGRIGDAVQRPQVLPGPQGRFRRARLGQGPLPCQQPVRIELAVELIRATQQMLGEFHGRELPGADAPAQGADGLKMERGVVHGAAPAKNSK
jgi:hypothetical protein